MKMRLPNFIAQSIALLVGCFGLVLPEQLSADHHETSPHNTQTREKALSSSSSAAALGSSADSAATAEWRKRRADALASELAKRGIHVSKEKLDYWIASGDIEDADRELAFLIQTLRGTPTTSMLSVGMLMIGQSINTAYSKCTVTLTQPDTILTARHCLSDTHGDKLWVYFPYGGVRRVDEDQISFHCNDEDSTCSPSIDDLAMAKLDTPYMYPPPSVAGAAISAVNGSKAKIIGFGLNSPDLGDYGVKREGEIELANCNMVPADGLSLCFEHPLYEDGTTSIYAACNNDSGGPMFSLPIGSHGIIGVASQMFGACDGEGEGRYVNATNVRYLNWLKDAYCDPPCTANPNLFITDVMEPVPIEYLDATETEHAYPFSVPEGASSLIITLNHGRGWVPDLNDFDLELSAVLTADCKRFIEAEVCEVEAPPAGNYTATVKRIQGEADYQLSAVALSTTGETRPMAPNLGIAQSVPIR